MRHYVEIIRGTKSKANPTKYYLNDNGRKAQLLGKAERKSEEVSQEED